MPAHPGAGTVWRSADDLDAYRMSVETPEGVRMFRAVDAEPALTVFDVAGHAGTPYERAR